MFSLLLSLTSQPHGNCLSQARYRPTIDALDDRTVPASLSVTATLSSGVLKITGSPLDDRIVVRQMNSQITVQDGLTTTKPTVGSFASSKVTHSGVDSKDGNDIVDVGGSRSDAVRVPARLLGGAGQDELNGGKGSDY